MNEDNITVLAQIILSFFKKLKKYIIFIYEYLHFFLFRNKSKRIEKYFKFNKIHYGRTRFNYISDIPFDVLKIYTHEKVYFNGKEYSSEEIISDAEQLSRIVITGEEGIGKTATLRKVLLDCIENNKYIPIYLEINNSIHYMKDEEFNIEKYILYELNNCSLKISLLTMQKLLKRGKVIVLIDDFDKLYGDSKKNIENAILNLANKYYNSKLIIAIKNFEREVYWESFDICVLRGFTYENALQFAERISEQSEYQFDKKRVDNFYYKRITLMRNPQMFFMLLVLYNRGVRSFETEQLIYDESFNFIFNHNETNLRSELDREVFKNILEYLSFQILCERNIYTFRIAEQGLIDILGKSKEVLSLTFNENKFLYDLETVLHIIEKDGLYYVMSQYSIMASFAANYLTKNQEVLQDCCNYNWNDLLFSDVFELFYKNDPKAAYCFIRPTTKSLLLHYTELSFFEFMQHMFSKVKFKIVDEQHVSFYLHNKKEQESTYNVIRLITNINNIMMPSRLNEEESKFIYEKCGNEQKYKTWSIEKVINAFGENMHPSGFSDVKNWIEECMIFIKKEEEQMCH